MFIGYIGFGAVGVKSGPTSYGEAAHVNTPGIDALSIRGFAPSSDLGLSLSTLRPRNYALKPKRFNTLTLKPVLNAKDCNFNPDTSA